MFRCPDVGGVAPGSPALPVVVGRKHTSPLPPPARCRRDNDRGAEAHCKKILNSHTAVWVSHTPPPRHAYRQDLHASKASNARPVSGAGAERGALAEGAVRQLDTRHPQEGRQRHLQPVGILGEGGVSRHQAARGAGRAREAEGVLQARPGSSEPAGPRLEEEGTPVGVSVMREHGLRRVSGVARPGFWRC